MLDTNDIYVTTIFTIDKLLEYKNGGDALLLYFRYMKQSKHQKTNQTFSKDVFMMEGMGRGKDRFYNSKKVLQDLNLIDIVIVKNNKGQYDDVYVKVNMLIGTDVINDIIRDNYEEISPENQSPGNPESGNQETNAGISKYKYTYKKKSEKTVEAITTVDELRTYYDTIESRPFGREVGRILCYMIELGYRPEKSVPALVDFAERCKESAVRYLGQNIGGDVPYSTLESKAYEWYTRHKEKKDKIKNYRSSLLTFLKPKTK